jgi:signal transduction histidine kinase
VSQDPLLLSFVIDSLLNNAIKYSPANGEVTIAGRRRGNQFEISVKDNGPGVPEPKQAELFQAFSRSEQAGQDFSVQGAGLSLYLDKLIVDYLGGSISLESQAGQGTKVTFTLPA